MSLLPVSCDFWKKINHHFESSGDYFWNWEIGGKLQELGVSRKDRETWTIC